MELGFELGYNKKVVFATRLWSIEEAGLSWDTNSQNREPFIRPLSRVAFWPFHIKIYDNDHGGI